MASLPESFDTLVTALEANVEVPKMEIVTERLLNEERKQTNRETSVSSEGAFAADILNGEVLLSVTVVTKLVMYNVTVLNELTTLLIEPDNLLLIPPKKVQAEREEACDKHG